MASLWTLGWGRWPNLLKSPTNCEKDSLLGQAVLGEKARLNFEQDTLFLHPLVEGLDRVDRCK